VNKKPSAELRIALLAIAGGAVVASMMGVVAPVSGQSSLQGLWTTKAPLPVPYGEVAAVAFDGKL
jgi:hypothetical protein